MNDFEINRFLVFVYVARQQTLRKHAPAAGSIVVATGMVLSFPVIYLNKNNNTRSGVEGGGGGSWVIHLIYN